MKDIRTLVKEVLPEVIELRRHIHMHPEVSMHEYETTEAVCKKLDEYDIPYRRTPETGVIADIKGGLGVGPVVMLRADMDALTVPEETGLEFSSKNEGIMHACGHDIHTSLLVGTAKVINELKDTFRGTVRLVFQPGEEVAKGASYMIQNGALNDVDMCFGLHIKPQTDRLGKPGSICLLEGPLFGACDEFIIKLKGRGSHGSQPHKGVDALVAAASMVMNLQTMVSREFDPMKPAVVTVGKLVSGTRFNILAEEAEMTGTCRCFDEDVWQQMPVIMERIVKDTASAMRCSAEIQFNRLTKPLINKPYPFSVMKAGVEKVIPADMIVRGEKNPGGEDYAEYIDIVPGAFMELAVGGDYPLHNPHAVFDESSFENGICAEVSVALEALKDLASER